jgi:DNA-binding IclR family transcriptional regulator
MSIAPEDSAWCASTPKRFGPTEQPGSGLKSVGAALDVLECFATDDELGVSDVARRLGCAKSTAHRLLTTLVTRGFVEQDAGTGQYRLGIHIYELGQLALQRNQLRHIALPVMRQVARATGLTVNLGVPDGADIVFVERLENADGVRILGHAGRRLPAHCTSSGKAIAAHNEEANRARLSAGFPPRARGTVRSPADWHRVIDQVRREGYAVSHDASFDGASSVAVAILERKRAIASLSVFGPNDLITPKVDHLVPLLIAAANRISRAYTS